jgi:hypothetical protein
MPLTKPEDCAGGNMNADSCAFCTDDNGKIKPCEEIFEGGVQFFIGATGSPRKEAEKLVRKNMLSLPYWKGNKSECLKGEVASDEEFQAALGKL